MVAGTLATSCAAPPTKTYTCGTGAIIDSITLSSAAGVNSISKFTCKDAVGTITSKTVNIGNSASGTSVTITGSFFGFSSGYAVSPNPTDAASGLTFIKSDSSTTPTYGTSYTSITTQQCPAGQFLYGLTIGLDSSGSMVGGKLSAKCRVQTCTQANPCVCTATQRCTGSLPPGYYSCDGAYCDSNNVCTSACQGATFTNSHVWCSNYGCQYTQFTSSTISCNTGSGDYPCYGSTATDCSLSCDSYHSCNGMTVSGGTASCYYNTDRTCSAVTFTAGCHVTCNNNQYSCHSAIFTNGACCSGGYCNAGDCYGGYCTTAAAC